LLHLIVINHEKLYNLIVQHQIKRDHLKSDLFSLLSFRPRVMCIANCSLMSSVIQNKRDKLSDDLMFFEQLNSDKRKPKKEQKETDLLNDGQVPDQLF
jgi:hypothetical protein